MIPDLRVVLLTFNRFEYAERTIRSLLENIEYGGKIYVHIADDGTGEDYRKELHYIAGGYKNVSGVSESNSERGGYGRNYNIAMQIVHQNNHDLILPLEDDWELLRKFDVDSYLAVFEDGHYGCLRLGYIGFTQELRSKFVTIDGKFYLHLDNDSPEPHVFAGHPRLESVAWERFVGPWPEGLLPGATEFEVAHRKEARTGVLWPCDVYPCGDLFAHIGTDRSY